MREHDEMKASSPFFAIKSQLGVALAAVGPVFCGFHQGAEVTTSPTPLKSKNRATIRTPLSNNTPTRKHRRSTA